MGKKLYITTAIPYVNGKPHVGNALDYLLADIWSRYQKQNGKEVRFQVGTDEHGTKIAQKAAESNMTPQDYVDSMYGNFKTLMGALDIQYTDFVRTTDGHHRGAVQYIWEKLAPHIYKDKYEGWYCQGCEAFVTDKDAAANNGVCPEHGQPYQRLSEDNYYLRASDFTDKVREAIEKNRLRIIPEYRKKEFLELMKDGLADVSISRPKKNLSWGVEVPGDPEHVMYVWMDALCNYLTALGYPDNSEWQDYWPADVQVVGKDILRFHAGLWPAILEGLDLSLPKTLLVHGFVDVDGAKMSKSVGNVIDPMEVIENYGAEAFRYYFARYVQTQYDGDFTWEKFENAYNADLCNDLGNLVQRVASMLRNYQAGVIGDAPQAEHDMEPYRLAMKEYNFDKALDEIMLTVRSLNRYLEDVKPWQIAKRRDSDPEEASHLAEVLAYASSTLLQVADLLVPFMPATAEKIHQTFSSGVVPNDIQPLFPRVYIHTKDPRASKPVAK